MAAIEQVIPANKLDKRLSHLTLNERAALAALVDRLHQRYGGDLLRVVLFGSKARGDFDDESDLDVLVVVRKLSDEEYWKQRRQISDAAFDLELQYDVVFSLLVMDEMDDMEMNRANMLINQNIKQDGVVLWSLPRNVLTLKSE